MKVYRETIIWIGHPSQFSNLGYFLICLTFSFLILPIAFLFWRWLETRCTIYKVTNQRVIISNGIFNKTTDQLEIYRIRDYRQEQPFLLRIFGLSNIVLISNDRTNKVVELVAIRQGEKMISEIRHHVENLRSTKSRII
ncbi:PH domain-containing protein [Acinetobacter guerrae]|uniref:PH domain-containing protein n=1 Tax=Acinetobacter guerrae TaxID=1843371 RepID=A0A3A8EKN1_9GAMM|nr:PH domain-containing protein [Acinetobacter guerrae]RKG35477.1 PH domain-containing protein [Acinetobacter guerrae]